MVNRFNLEFGVDRRATGNSLKDLYLNLVINVRDDMFNLDRNLLYEPYKKRFRYYPAREQFNSDKSDDLIFDVSFMNTVFTDFEYFNMIKETVDNLFSFEFNKSNCIISYIDSSNQSIFLSENNFYSDGSFRDPSLINLEDTLNYIFDKIDEKSFANYDDYLDALGEEYDNWANSVDFVIEDEEPFKNSCIDLYLVNKNDKGKRL